MKENLADKRNEDDAKVEDNFEKKEKKKERKKERMKYEYCYWGQCVSFE